MTQVTIKRKLNNKEYDLYLTSVSISQLMFNPYNTRIYDFIKSNKELKEFEMNGQISNLDTVQQTIFKHLRKNFDSKDNRSIIDSIKKDGIQDKMIVTKDNLLLSGNNRLSIIKTLMELNQWNHGDEIEVFKIEENITKEEILLIELEIQNVQSKQLKYDVINNIRRAKELLDNGVDSSRALALTNQSNFSERYIRNFDNAIEKLSKYYEVQNIMEYVADLKLYSWIDYYVGIYNTPKYKSKAQILKAINNIFMNAMIFMSVDIAFLDFRFQISKALKMVSEDETILIEFSKAISNIYEDISDDFADYIKSDINNDFSKFREERSGDLIEAKQKLLKYFDKNKSFISNVKLTTNTRNKFNINLESIPKSDENIERAKKLVTEINKWLEI